MPAAGGRVGSASADGGSAAPDVQAGVGEATGSRSNGTTHRHIAGESVESSGTEADEF